MIDEPLIAIEVRAEDARALLAWLKGALALYRDAPAEKRSPHWSAAVPAMRRIVATLERGPRSASLQAAAELALAYLTNVNAAERHDVVATLCGALRDAGGDADLLDGIEDAAAKQAFAAASPRVAIELETETAAFLAAVLPRIQHSADEAYAEAEDEREKAWARRLAASIQAASSALQWALQASTKEGGPAREGAADEPGPGGPPGA